MSKHAIAEALIADLRREDARIVAPVRGPTIPKSQLIAGQGLRTAADGTAYAGRYFFGHWRGEAA